MLVRVFLVWCGIALAAMMSVSKVTAGEPSVSESLKAASKGLFHVGVGLNVADARDGAGMELIKANFDYVTPENCMKPAAIQNRAGKFRFAQADAFVEFAVAHGFKINGHCLVWAKDDRTPGWFFGEGESTASNEELVERMQSHLKTVVDRYGDKIGEWDVVNEALADASTVWRDSTWHKTCGPDFVVSAFKAARAAAPKALLTYNDYRLEMPGKRESLFQLIEFLQSHDAPIDAIGLQGHYVLDQVPYEDLQFTLDKIRGYGLKAVVTEVDIDIHNRNKWWSENGKYRDELKDFDPFKDGCPDDVLQRQADQFAKLFEVYAKNADIIERVTFWNLHDGQSWLNDFPWQRVNYPVLFDRELQPKPAYFSVIKVLQKFQSAAGK